MRLLFGGDVENVIKIFLRHGRDPVGFLPLSVDDLVKRSEEKKFGVPRFTRLHNPGVYVEGRRRILFPLFRQIGNGSI
jgi:hypothetical protein